MAKIYSLMLIVLCGCSTAGQLDTSAFLAEVDKLNQPVVSKIDSNTETLAEIQSSINTFATKQLELDEQIVSLLTKKEASLIVSNPEPGKEVIKSEDTSPDNNANDSQPVTRSVAESGDVSLSKPYLQVWSTSWCVHCPATLDAARSVAKEFDISCVPLKDQPQDVVDKCQIGCYPTITLCRDGVQVAKLEAGQKRESLRAWLVKQGLTPVAQPTAQIETPRSIDLVGLHNQLHGGGSWTWPGDLATHLQNTHGVMLNGNQSSYVGSQTYRSRSVVRSVPYRSAGVWRSRSVSRSSCPSGNCP